MSRTAQFDFARHANTISCGYDRGTARLREAAGARRRLCLSPRFRLSLLAGAAMISASPALAQAVPPQDQSSSAAPAEPVQLAANDAADGASAAPGEGL